MSEDKKIHFDYKDADSLRPFLFQKTAKSSQQDIQDLMQNNKDSLQKQ